METLDPTWSQQVGPYAPYQVAPSGTAQPVTLTLSPGADTQQDILMQGSAVARTDLVGTSSFASPLPVPNSGIWTGDLSSYGEVDYLSLNAQSGQTAVIDVTTLDEKGAATEVKAQPLIGAWSITDPAGSLPPAVTSSPFNIGNFGVTRLNAQFMSSGQFRVGIGDLRGDGRPDYRYLARVLYADSLEPSRVGVGGGSPIEIDGIGFQNGMTVSIGSLKASILSLTSNEIYVSAPAAADGTQSLTITDPESGASVALNNMLTLGAGPNDMIRLTQSINPSVPVGGEAASPIRVAVTSADGSTPVGGATVQWSASNGATLTACKGSPGCFVLSDESGKVETRVDVGAVGASTITATLAPASYSPAKSVQATVSGTSSATDLAIFTPKVWVAKGTTVDVPLTTRLLSNGSPVSGGTINFQVLLGSGVVTFPSVITDANGYARSAVHVSNLTSDVQGSACVAPGNNPCQTFYVVAVAATSLRLENVSGSQQAIWVGQSFQPVSLRVTDSSTPANPVAGATVVVQGAMFLPGGDEPGDINQQNNGEASSSNHAMQVVLGSFQNTLVTDANGIVTFTPNNGGLYRPMEVIVSASAGATALLQFDFQQLPAMMNENEGASTGKARSPAGPRNKLMVVR